MRKSDGERFEHERKSDMRTFHHKIKSDGVRV